LLQREQFRSESDAGPENSSALEEPQAFDPDWNPRSLHRPQLLRHARCPLFVHLTQKLQGDMPAFRLRPPQLAR
jgi:hypothetical protein